MKKWVAPELFELKTEWTENDILTSGVDEYGPSIEIGGEDLTLGSCKSKT